jgi:2-iminobutanoate/2-iminopropanoate deaminase
VLALEQSHEGSLAHVRELVTAAGAPKAIGPYSPALKVGNLLFLSGSIPLDPASGQLVPGGIVEQTTQVMENIKSLLEAAGASVNHVARTTVFMVDLGEFAQMNEIYAKYFTAPYPARSTVQVVKLPKDVRVEIDVIAVLG